MNPAPLNGEEVNDFSPEGILPPAIEARSGPDERIVTLKGSWNLRGLGAVRTDLRRQLKACAEHPGVRWELRQIRALDSAGAFILWQSWGGRLPEHLYLRPEHKSLFARWQQRRVPSTKGMTLRSTSFPGRLGRIVYGFGDHFLALVVLLGQLVLDLAYLTRHPRDIPWREISATIYRAGGRALGITALVGFLIGVVVSYLSALQLQAFGAQIYIVNLLGLSIIRELGPLLAAILVAGRSGSAMTARIGVMRLTEELDALSALGISHSLRLVLPKVLALAVAMPLLVVWTDAIALIGGILSAQLTLGIGYHQFVLQLSNAVPVVNFIIGLGKGAVFGLLIALVACHFGFRIKPNTESLGNETTNSVVTSITLVILVDAVFAIVFQGVGLS